jgi:hypothetical protein
MVIEIIGRVVGLEGRIVDFNPPFSQLEFASIEDADLYLAEHFWEQTVYRIIGRMPLSLGN